MSCMTRTVLPMFEKARQFNAHENPMVSTVGSRTLYLMTAPVALVSSIADMGIGLVAATGTFLSLGMQRDVFRYTQDQLAAGGRMLTGPYECFLRTLSPTAEYDPGAYRLLSQRLLDLGTETARECRISDHVIIEHGASRLLYFATMIGLIFTRTIELAIGLVTVPLSLLCLGQWSMMNAIASNCLHAPFIIDDIFYLTMNTINP